MEDQAVSAPLTRVTLPYAMFTNSAIALRFTASDKQSNEQEGGAGGAGSQAAA